MRVRVRVIAAALALTAGSAATVALAGLPHAESPAQSPAPVAAVAADVAAPSPLAASRSRRVAVTPPVAALKTLRVPDLLVTVRRSLTPAQLKALHAIRGMEGVTTLDIGSVHLPTGKGLRIAGVDPSQFRQFTPRQTAASDPLWQSVARGELASSYGVVRERHLTLGAAVTVRGLRTVDSRIGAVAVFGMPGIDLVTSRVTARSLGVVPASAVLLNAPERSLRRLQAAVRAVVGESADIDVLRPVEIVVNRKPKTYRELYIDSAKYCPGLRWQVLAAIGQIESGHGRNMGPSSAGALGPMQFMPATWAFSGVDGDGDGKADIMNPYDAVPAAALYLCRAGAANGEQGLYDAIFSYNHADWYVKQVLDLAARYR
ncbi:MAG: lytic transglycosylase domain-containing protein [Frankiaceae bacterium]|nr:lytic transglycosylase domain-containing protein [Frankiaceae bacterium]